MFTWISACLNEWNRNSDVFFKRESVNIKNKFQLSFTLQLEASSWNEFFQRKQTGSSFPVTFVQATRHYTLKQIVETSNQCCQFQAFKCSNILNFNFEKAYLTEEIN